MAEAMSTYYPMIYDFLVEQGLSKAAAALKTESKIDLKTPRHGESLSDVLKVTGAKRGREGEANGHAAKKGPAAAASDDDDDDDDDDDSESSDDDDDEKPAAAAPKASV